MTAVRRAVVTTDELLEILTRGDLELTGRLVDASNATLVGYASLDGVDVTCVYKPTRGERPLWDFPDRTLGRREVATYAVSETAGWGVVPPTVWRPDGPLGAGMAQAWVEPGPGAAADPGAGLVDVVPPESVPAGWRSILDARGDQGQHVVLAHAEDPDLLRMALLDAVVNNADRKGGHVLRGRTPRDAADRVYGVDHGLTFHEDDKLRTVLWGWAGEPLPADAVEALLGLDAALGDGLPAALCELSNREVRRVRVRVRALVAGGTFPLPGQGWPSLPWPAF